MLVLIEVLLVESDLPVRRFRLAQLTDGSETIGTQIGEHVFDSPQPIRPRLHSKANFGTGFDELILNVAWHKPSLLGLDVGALEGGEIHVGAGEGDAGGLLILEEA